MWSCGSTEFVVTSLQGFDVTLSTTEDQYWRETALTDEEV